jgi:hypothetical protein
LTDIVFFNVTGSVFFFGQIIEILLAGASATTTTAWPRAFTRSSKMCRIPLSPSRSKSSSGTKTKLTSREAKAALAAMKKQDEGAPVLVQELRQDNAFRNVGYSVSNAGILVFQSVADSASQLVWCDRSGRELGILPAPVSLDPVISPDGRSVAVVSDDDRNSRLFVRVFDLSRGVGMRVSNGGGEDLGEQHPGDGANGESEAGNVAETQTPAPRRQPPRLA